MNNSNTDDLAFPFAYQGSTTAPEVHYGMELRDYFAARALQGGLAHNRPAADTAGWAKWAYQVADAMMVARKKGGAA